MAPIASGKLRSTVGGGAGGFGPSGRRSTTTVSAVAISAGPSTRIVLAVLKSADWVQLRIDEMHPHMLDTGGDLGEALALQRQHSDLMHRLKAKQGSVEDLLSQADKLVLEQPAPEAAVYEAMADSLGSAWKDLNRQLGLRTTLLEEAVAFFRTVDAHGEELDALDRGPATTGAEGQEDLQRLIAEQERRRSGLLATATKATGEGQGVIGRIRELGPLVDNPDRPRLTMEACQRIEDVMLRLSERRRRVETSWEDRLHQLQFGIQAAELWRDLKLVEEWLGRAEERMRTASDLGASELSNEALLKEHEAFCGDAKRNEELLAGVWHSSEAIARQGCPDGHQLQTRCQGLRDRMSGLRSALESRRQVLGGAGHFFAGATRALALLESLDTEIRHAAQGSLSRRAEAAAAAEAELGRKVADAAGPAIAVGSALLGRLADPDGPGASGVKAKLRELEERRQRLEGLCNANREHAMARSRALTDFDAAHSCLHLWLLNVAEAFLATYRDMGTTHSAACDFVERHRRFGADLTGKEVEVQALLHKGAAVQGQPGSADYADVSDRLAEFHSRWDRLKVAVERRIQIGSIYAGFHKAAVDLTSDVDALEAGLRSSREEGERHLEELWARLTQGYANTRHQGEHFLADSRSHRVDESLELRRAQATAEALLEALAERHRLVGSGWDEWRALALRSKEFTAQWTRFETEVRSTLDQVLSLQREASGAFGHFEDTPSKVADRIQTALADFLPRARALQQDIENRLRRAEALDAPSHGREAKDRLIQEILDGNARLTHTITWFDVIGTQLVTFFRNLHQLDDWSRRVESKFSAESLPRMDAMQMEDLVREHEAARQSVSQMIKFAHTEGDQIILRARQPEVPRSVTSETEKLPSLLNSRVRNWEEVWTKQHRQLSSVSSTARVLRDLSELLATVGSMEQRLEGFKRQAGSSQDGARLVADQFRDFERSILEVDIRIRNLLSTISARPYAGEPQVGEAGDELRRRWEELKARTNNFHSVLSTSSSFFTLLEENESWFRETTEYISEVGRASEAVQSSEEANSLLGRVENYAKPRTREMEDRLKRVDTAAVQLFGEDAGHRTESTKRRFKEVVDSFVSIQQRLVSTADSWRQKEAAQRQRDAPRFTEPLRDAEALEGKGWELSCRVEGRPMPQPHWFKDGVPVLHNPDYQTSFSGGVCTLRIVEAFMEDAGTFLCRATNDHGSAETQARIGVKESPLLRMQPPDFTRKLGNVRLEVGSSLLLEAHVSASPTAAVSWFKDDECVDDWAELEMAYNNGICTLRIPSAVEKDAGLYVCKAQNPAGHAATSASVSVAQRNEAPVFSRYLSDAAILAGQDLRLAAAVQGKPQPQLFWSLGSRPLNDGSARLSYDGREAGLRVERAGPNAEGTYRLVARNVAGEAVSTCHVSVTDVEANKPRFSTELHNVSVVEGTTVRLDAVLSGTPTPEVDWSKDEAPLIQTERVRVVAEGGHVGVFLPSTQVSNSGVYKCVARSKLGEAVTVCRLTVTKKADPPRLMPTLQSQTLTVGSRCMLEARAIADPAPTITWSHNDRELHSGPNVQILKDGDWHRLVIPRVELSDHGDYTILAVNDGGSARSICALSVVEAPPPKPPQPAPQPTPPPPQYHTSRVEVVEEYSSEAHQTAPHGTPPAFRMHFASSYRATPGSKVKMECHLVGNPRPKTTWSFNGRPIPPGMVQLSNMGDTYAVIIPVVGPGHQGVYSLRGVNEMGTAESSCKLVLDGGAPVQSQQEHRSSEHRSSEHRSSAQEVRVSETRTAVAPRPDVAAPHFTQTLVSVVAADGEDVNFAATVTGKPAPDISWSRDGRPLFEGNGVRFEHHNGSIRLHIRSAKETASGKYVCTARNPAGFATSSAQLVVRAVTDAPDFVERLISREVGEGESLRWTVEIVGVPPPTVTWLRNGAVIPHCQDVQLVDEGRGRHSLVIPRAELVDGGQFTVRAENSAGEARSTADLVIRPKGQAPGQYYHVTKVTQEQQEVGMEVSSAAHYQNQGSRSSSRPL